MYVICTLYMLPQHHNTPSTLLYGQQVWCPEIRFQCQEVELAKIQRRALLALTRCYRTISYTKLFGVLAGRSGHYEMRYFRDLRSLGGQERAGLYERTMGEQGYDETYKQLRNSRRKETLWCVTQHGPF